MIGPIGSLHGYPRPQLERSGWQSLNGIWDFALDAESQWNRPEQIAWNGVIRVPFAPETKASGVENRGFYRACWYRHAFERPELSEGEQVILHFGAVDYAASVWVNGQLVVRHEGGHTPFEANLTDVLTADGPQTIVVQAEDDPHDLAKPRGKQDWQLEPHSIWYPRTTGIWQTVWLEIVPSTWIDYLRWTPSLDRWEIGLEARLDGHHREGLRLNVKLHQGNTLLADDTYAVVAGEVHRRIGLSDPGIDDYRNELLWSPSKPTLIHAQLQLLDDAGQVLDTVRSYTALRSIGVQGDRFVLNGRPCPLRMVLDQGYWPDTGLTPPNDDALRHDVELAKAMGFNGVRKHQKIEDPRYLYWADTLGLLVWEEMPSAYRFTKRSVQRLTREWTEAIARDLSHPCIIAWVPFNESWGVPDLPDSPGQRHYIQALYHLTKTLDPTRPVVGNDGWESVATDLLGIHDYDHKLEHLAHRYGTDEVLPQLFKRERPGGRMLLVGDATPEEQPIILTEFGGIAYADDSTRTWGYTRVENAKALAEQYTRLLSVVGSLRVLSGFCYTQFADTYQEANGLLYADRTPKIPLETIRNATCGVADAEQTVQWRERLMEVLRGRA
jgi:beta-galactosidase/beta-glucuronidase